MDPDLKRGLVILAAGVICLLADAAAGGAGPCGGLVVLGSSVICAVGLGKTVVGVIRVLRKSTSREGQSGL